jgi:hypothetical protein
VRSTRVLLAAALLVPLAGCKPHALPGPDSTPASTPEPVWVVQSTGYSRGPNLWSVNCVPRGEERLPESRISVVRQIGADKATAYGAEQGDVCPPGPLLAEF